VWVNWDNPVTMPDEHNQLFNIYKAPGEANGILGVEAGWLDGDLRFWDSKNDAEHNLLLPDWSGRWNHYAFVKDVAAEYLKIYHNGALVAETDSNTPIGGPVAIAYIGVGADQPDDWHDEYTGLLDDLRIYNTALSDDQVAYIATDGSGYFPLELEVNIYDAEPAGGKAVNFRDFAKLMTAWLQEQLWPQ
jgi:hypothetical protein